jgi:signal transduction histidine kinase
MRSLRFRLLALWIMLVASGAATAYLLYESFQQGSNARVARSEELVARACRDIAERYQFFAAGWSGSAVDDRLKQEFTTVVQTALADSIGVEGGIWQAEDGPLAYAFPSYEGTGPKTDVPAAEYNTIRQVNEEALGSGHTSSIHQSGRSQVLLVHACPLGGPLPRLTAWTMTRVFTAQGPGYHQLLAGLTVLVLTIFGSAAWLASLLYSWSRKIAQIENTLARRESGSVDIPRLDRTGEQELDRLVDALNSLGERLGTEQRRAAAAERLAAVGRLSAGLAHEIRNPIAAMRLKAENALAARDGGRKEAALEIILQQIARLDALLRDLLEMTHGPEARFSEVDLPSFLQRSIETHRELAAQKKLTLTLGTPARHEPLPCFDPFRIQRALDNLLLNAIQNTPAGGRIAVDACKRGDALLLRVSDTGPGVSDEVRERLFEPFATTRSGGTGLGLAIVREIARSHHGDARLAKSEGGATFEIELPWQPS